MASLENNCESVIIAILGASADLLNYQIVHEDDDDQADKDRIVVSASPREIALHGKDQSSVKAWQVDCRVEVFFVTRSESSYDDVIAAVEAALNAATPPAAALGIWVSSFPNGAQLEQINDGEADTSDNTRTRARAFRFIVIP